MRVCVCVSIIGSSVWNVQILSSSVKQTFFSSGSKIKILEENLSNICKIFSDMNKYFWYVELLFKGKEII